MSIPLLAQVYDETRRLAIAGSVVAPGDFRIKKLVEPLQQAGAKAPVFAKVADGVKAVVESNDKTSAQSLLDLATLVTAILYTQGETGAPGDLQPIETTDLGIPATQTSARVLKPLLEALTTTGSGRLELIRDAFERGEFRDLRLIQPAVAAIDDVYPEAADFITSKVLPLYGKAILPSLRSTFDVKGRAGHPRRLRLMHNLDPVGTREIVKQALEDGSKDVKVAAVECLGALREDLSYLIEQASAKAQDVRRAAYLALAKVDEADAVAVLKKAFDDKDLELASEALRTAVSDDVRKFVVAGVDKGIDEVAAFKDKKDVSAALDRLRQMLHCLVGREDRDVDELVSKLFDRREDFRRIKGATTSGSDLNSMIVQVMARGSPRLRRRLVDRHRELAHADFDACFVAARRTLGVEELYDAFSRYLLAEIGDKKDTAYAKRAAVMSGLHPHRMNHYGLGYHESIYDPAFASRFPLDPRWLDAAVYAKNAALVAQLIRPGHAAANAFLTKTFAEQFKKAKQLYDCQDVVHAMIRGQHPDATDAFVSVLEKFGDKAGYYGYYLGQLVIGLPKSALPRLEALIPKLHDQVADNLLGFLQQLRDKAD